MLLRLVYVERFRRRSSVPTPLQRRVASKSKLPCSAAPLHLSSPCFVPLALGKQFAPYQSSPNYLSQLASSHSSIPIYIPTSNHPSSITSFRHHTPACPTTTKTALLAMFRPACLYLTLPNLSGTPNLRHFSPVIGQLETSQQRQTLSSSGAASPEQVLLITC